MIKDGKGTSDTVCLVNAITPVVMKILTEDLHLYVAIKSLTVENVDAGYTSVRITNTRPKNTINSALDVCVETNLSHQNQMLTNGSDTN